jgi:long-chain fatty acid transport protein
MTNIKRTTPLLIFAVFTLGGLAGEAKATNGMNTIGYSPRSSGMGGADVAVANDSTGSAGNPASLGISVAKSASMGLGILAPGLSQSDNRNNRDGNDKFFPLPQLNYAQPVSDDLPLVWGINLYAQGGMGVEFDNIRTFNNNIDTYDSMVSYSRFTGALNYLIDDDLSVGVGLMAGYARTNFSLFPNTYSVGMDNTAGTYDDFLGVDASGISGFGMAGRIGMQYQLNSLLRLGMQYSSEASLNLDNGEMTLNYGAMRVKYDAEIEGFTWPRECEAGVAIQATSDLLVAADIKWLNWSSSVDQVTVKGSNPSQQGVPQNPALTFNMNWNDQWVFALGAEYSLSDKQQIRAGYNYGKNPIPNDNLSPLFPAIVEHHLSMGYSYLWPSWQLSIAYEYGFNNSQTNNNPGPPSNQNGIANPFGPGVTVDHRQQNLHIQISYIF